MKTWQELIRACDAAQHSPGRADRLVRGVEEGGSRGCGEGVASSSSPGLGGSPSPSGAGRVEGPGERI